MTRSDSSRRTFFKIFSLALAGGWLSACAPEAVEAGAQAASEDSLAPTASVKPSHTAAASATRQATAAASPTLPPIPTTAASHTPAPTLAPSPTARPAEARGILTPMQTTRLAERARKYVAETEEDATRVARSLGYLENDGHPASVCGPLSAAVLRDAGLISAYTDLHEFWLLNPRLNLPVLERTFPKDEFTWFHTDQSTAAFDFKSFPLMAGDFLYLFAGDPGSFEHMLTVSKVDEEGRAYTVTNIHTPEGYVIQEVLLVDPEQPGVGQLADWTNRQKNGKLGLTGFGGFLLIRFNTPVHDPSAWERQFARDLDSILENAGGTWRIYIKEIGGPVLYARDERRILHPASIIKLPIAMLFFKSLEQMGIRDYEAATSKGIDGRSYQQLLHAMLVKSEEKAADSLAKAIRANRLDVRATLQAWNVAHTYIEVRQSTARDIATLFEGLYNRDFLEPAPREILLDYLAEYTPGDDLRLGMMRQYLPPGTPFYNKRGTITDELLVAADAALVRIPLPRGDVDYLLVAFGYQGEKQTTFDRLEMALGEIGILFWQFTRGL
jgi:hypothetical protein